MRADNGDTVITSGERVVTASDWRGVAHRAAAGFLALGLKPAFTVAVMLRNDLAFFEAMEAARVAGACFVPVNWHLTAREVDYILEDAQADVLVIHADLLTGTKVGLKHDPKVLVVPVPDEIRWAYGLDDDQCRIVDTYDEWYGWLSEFEPLAAADHENGSFMLYTSGTTGHPKGVRREAQVAEETAVYLDSIMAAFGLRLQARTVVTGPLYHAGPLGYARAVLRAQGSMLMMPRFDPEQLLQIIEAERITHMHVVPIMFVRLLRLPPAVRNRYDLRSLECVIHGAAACPVDIKRQMIDWWGPVIREYYGSTEASIGCAVGSHDWLSHPGTVGQPLPGIKLAIFDHDGHRLPAGEIGEIHYRQSLAPNFDYHNRSAERVAIEREGLLSNGDLGYQDEEGFVYLCGRSKEMIISGGVNIYPAEIEAALLAHSGVADCAVYGVPDDEFGESVHAAVQPVPGQSLEREELLAHLNGRIAKFKWPRELHFHAALPRADNGKVYKQLLHELAQRKSADETS